MKNTANEPIFSEQIQSLEKFANKGKSESAIKILASVNMLVAMHYKRYISKKRT